VRVAEAIHVVVFTYFGILGWTRPLPRGRRAFLTAEAVVVVCGLTALSNAPPGKLTSVVRDWLPGALLLLAYWSSGLFVTSYNQRFQNALARVDREVFEKLKRFRFFWGRLPSFFFELAYLLCYLLVPLGLGALYFLRLRRYADDYWSIVLPPAHLCYGAVPFLRALPPRLVAGDPSPPSPVSLVRRLNLWILSRGSIEANTFPSAHVAAAGAAGLAIMHLAPPASPVFLLVAFGIAVGAVLGRYHYVADAIAGAVLALASYGAWLALSR